MDNLRLMHALPKSKIIEFLKARADAMGEEYWYVKSPSKKLAPTLVAHIDTVHEKRVAWAAQEWDAKLKKWVSKSGQVAKNKTVFFDEKQMVMWSPEGLGADDRAGVWGIIQVYESLPDELKPNLLFTDGEESGGTGAKEAAGALKVELQQSLFFIQLDRKNGKDAVFYNDEPKAFMNYICRFGFTKDTGSFSDITILGREVQLCGVNLSIGYYDNHTREEHLYVNSLLATVKKTKAIVSDAIEKGKVWDNEIKKVAVVRGYNHWGGHPYGGGYGDAYGCYHDDGVTDNDPSDKGNGRGTRQFSLYGLTQKAKHYPYYCLDRKMWIDTKDHDNWTATGSWSRKEGKKGKKNKKNKSKGVMDKVEQLEIERQERVNWWRKALGLPLLNQDKLDPDAMLFNTKPYGGEGP